ncbi:unnamed protein product [Urochloa humidicola]
MGCSKRCAVAGLPDDALVEILSRLPAKFLCRAKCVSKAWCSLIADRLRCRKLPLTLEGFFYGFVDGLFSEDSSGDDEESGCEDDKERDGQDGNEGGKEEKPSHHASGHFINLLGRSVPLVDPLFSTLRKQPGISDLTLLNSCNGLLLFGQPSAAVATRSYIVYNPATEHWVPVPSSGFSWIAMEYYDSDDEDEESCVLTYLIFDPVISSHFQLIEFGRNSEVALFQTYSSETERWGDKPRERR